MGCRFIVLVVVVGMANGCASGVYIEDLSADGRKDYQGYACDAGVTCGAGLECLEGLCIKRCTDDLECSGRTCLPLPLEAGGWCDFAGHEATPATMVVRVSGDRSDGLDSGEATDETETAPEGGEWRVPDIAPPDDPSNEEDDRATTAPAGEGVTIRPVAPEEDEEPAPIVAEDDPVTEGDGGPEAPDAAQDGVRPVPAPECEDVRSNQSAAEAVRIDAGARIEDAICEGRADFYHVSIRGFWMLQLAGEPAQRDLVVYLWNPLTHAPVVGLDGDAVASVTTGGTEVLAFLGEQIVVVVGPEEARAGYALSLFAL
jgi:hypothetical protein